MTRSASPESGGDLRERARAIVASRKLSPAMRDALVASVDPALGQPGTYLLRAGVNVARAMVSRELAVQGERRQGCSSAAHLLTPLGRAVAELLAAEAEGRAK